MWITGYCHNYIEGRIPTPCAEIFQQSFLKSQSSCLLCGNLPTKFPQKSKLLPSVRKSSNKVFSKVKVPAFCAEIFQQSFLKSQSSCLLCGNLPTKFPQKSKFLPSVRKSSNKVSSKVKAPAFCAEIFQQSFLKSQSSCLLCGNLPTKFPQKSKLLPSVRKSSNTVSSKVKALAFCAEIFQQSFLKSQRSCLLCGNLPTKFPRKPKLLPSVRKSSNNVSSKVKAPAFCAEIFQQSFLKSQSSCLLCGNLPTKFPQKSKILPSVREAPSLNLDTDLRLFVVFLRPFK